MAKNVVCSRFDPNLIFSGVKLRCWKTPWFFWGEATGEKYDTRPRRDHIPCARFKVLVALGHEVDHKLSSHP
jgi:hypothetical protein